jgi:acetate---CoA ligase (ADP-forming)
VFDSAPEALTAIRHAFAFRDRSAPQHAAPHPAGPSGRAQRWRSRLAEAAGPLTEAEGYALLADYGIPVPRHALVGTRAQAIAAAERIGFPVSLKTAMPGIAHKSEVAGVRLGLGDAPAVGAWYDEMAARLGPAALIAEQVPAAAELALGLLHDAGFGPFLMLASGGVWIELHGDAVLAQVPVDEAELPGLLDKLKIRPVLDGARGGPKTSPEPVLRLVERLSLLVEELGRWIAELDLNPVRIHGDRVIVADCLVVPANGLRGRAVRTTDHV